MPGIRFRARAVTLTSILLICAQLTVGPARAQDASPCTSGLLPGGAQHTIVTPQGWTPATGELLILAPGYTLPGEQAEVPTIDEDVFLTLSAFGFAIAGVTYRKSGLAVKQGAEDLEELLAFFTGDPLQCGYGRANRIWLVGGSEGGLIATLVGARHAADPAALAELEAFYTTSGYVACTDEGGSDVPVVVLHTESDPIVPF